MAGVFGCGRWKLWKWPKVFDFLDREIHEIHERAMVRSAENIASERARGGDARLGGTAAGRGDTAPVVCVGAHFQIRFGGMDLGRWKDSGWSFSLWRVRVP